MVVMNPSLPNITRVVRASRGRSTKYDKGKFMGHICILQRWINPHFNQLLMVIGGHSLPIYLTPRMLLITFTWTNFITKPFNTKNNQTAKNKANPKSSSNFTASNYNKRKLAMVFVTSSLTETDNQHNLAYNTVPPSISVPLSDQELPVQQSASRSLPPTQMRKPQVLHFLHLQQPTQSTQ